MTWVTWLAGLRREGQTGKCCSEFSCLRLSCCDIHWSDIDALALVIGNIELWNEGLCEVLRSSEWKAGDISVRWIFQDRYQYEHARNLQYMDSCSLRNFSVCRLLAKKNCDKFSSQISPHNPHSIRINGGIDKGI